MITNVKIGALYIHRVHRLWISQNGDLVSTYERTKLRLKDSNYKDGERVLVEIIENDGICEGSFISVDKVFFERSFENYYEPETEDKDDY